MRGDRSNTRRVEIKKISVRGKTLYLFNPLFNVKAN